LRISILNRIGGKNSGVERGAVVRLPLFICVDSASFHTYLLVNAMSDQPTDQPPTTQQTKLPSVLDEAFTEEVEKPKQEQPSEEPKSRMRYYVGLNPQLPVTDGTATVMLTRVRATGNLQKGVCATDDPAIQKVLAKRHGTREIPKDRYELMLKKKQNCHEWTYHFHQGQNPMKPGVEKARRPPPQTEEEVAAEAAKVLVASPSVDLTLGEVKPST
jgi:hypothetical protein